MESGEISLHLNSVYAVLKGIVGWITAKELAKLAQVADRTARAHLLRLVNAGIVDQAEVFPAHRYRLSPLAEKRNKTFLMRLEAAGEIFR